MTRHSSLITSSSCIVVHSICPLDKPLSQPKESLSLLNPSKLPLVVVLAAAHEREVPRRLTVLDAAALVVACAQSVHGDLLRRQELPVILVLVASLGRVHAVCRTLARLR